MQPILLPTKKGAKNLTFPKFLEFFNYKYVVSAHVESFRKTVGEQFWNANRDNM